MDSTGNSCPFFPLQQDELSTDCPEITLWDTGFDHIPYPGSPRLLEGIDLGDNSKGNVPNELEEIKGATANQDVQKKIIHRDIERQRRQEMASLYASLRSVLPADVLKGKRSTSDQIHEATKYIRHLQSNIKELGGRREVCNLKRLPDNDELPDTEKLASCSKILPAVVTVEPCSVGVEVLISGDFRESEGLNLPLSRILQLLLQEGLNVVTCNYTEYDGKSHYMIQSEVGCPGVNLQMLKRKLICMINFLMDVKK